MQRLATYISYISHPIWLAFVGVYFLVRWHFILDVKLSGRPELIYLAVFFISLVAIPAIGIMLLLGKYKPADFSNLEDSERRRTIAIMALIYIFLAMGFESLFIDRIIQIYLISLALITAVGFLVSQRMKISFHMLGWGALTAVAMLISRFAVTRIDWLIFTLIIVSGLVGFARLYLNAHRPAEIYAGYLTGLVVDLVFFGLIYGF